MCKCGCNKCDINKAPILNENMGSRMSLPPILEACINGSKPLTEGLTAHPTKAFIKTWGTVRALYSRGLIEVFGDDKKLITQTDIGSFRKYKGKNVPLDYPIKYQVVNEITSYEVYTILPNNNRKVTKVRFRSTNTNILEIIKNIRRVK